MAVYAGGCWLGPSDWIGREDEARCYVPRFELDAVEPAWFDVGDVLSLPIDHRLAGSALDPIRLRVVARVWHDSLTSHIGGWDLELVCADADPYETVRRYGLIGLARCR